MCECAHQDGAHRGGGNRGGAGRSGCRLPAQPAAASRGSRHTITCRGVSCPVCSVMAVLSAVLVMTSAPLASCAECGGHGSLHGDHCDCDKGYEYGASQLVCVASQVECGGHGDLHGDHCDCFTGYEYGSSQLVCVASEAECGGHGVLHGDHCDCEKGYVYGASKLVCEKPSWTTRLDDLGGSARNRVWQLLGKEPASELGVSEVQAMLDGLSGLHELHALEDHNDHAVEVNDHTMEADDHDHDDHAEEDADDRNEPGGTQQDLNEEQIESIPTRRLLQKVCSGHGHPHNGVCHCDSGYELDPTDNLICLSEERAAGPSAMPDSIYALSAAAIMDAAGSNGTLRMEDLAVALPLIASCQMDPTCSLDITPLPDTTGGSSAAAEDAGEVELWMALVATFGLFAVPMLSMFLPRLIFRMVSRERMTVLVSLGNCLSAGIVFSLGIMHIIPETVESSYKAGVGYPLNYFLISLGFFITLFAEEVIAGGHDAVNSQFHEHDHGFSCDVLTSFSTKDGESASVITSGSSGAIQVPVNSWNDDIATSERKSNTKRSASRKDMTVVDAVTKTMLPLVVFFLALQFHACLEAVVIGVQTDVGNFWTLFAGVAVHKSFVSFALGLKLHNNAERNEGHYDLYLISMALLWALLPALFVMVGFGLAEGASPMTKLILGSLCAGTFLYVGSLEILGEEFGHGHGKSPGSWGTKLSHRLMKFAAIMLGLLMAACLSFIPHQHD